MSRADVLIWRKIFESGDVERIAKQKEEIAGFADLSDLEIRKDISYIDDGEQGHLFDIYNLKGCPEDAPVLINIHGGGLFASYKEVNAHFNYEWARQGYKVVSISYRRIPETTLWHQIDDCMAAMRYISRNSARLGLDLSDCVLIGDSAGALLSLFVLSVGGSETLQQKFGIEGPGIRFKAAAFISIMLDTQRRDLLSVINDMVTDKEDKGKAYERYLLDPVSLLKETALPPVILITSDEDLIQKDTLKLDAMLNTHGVRHELINYPKGKKGDNELGHVFAVSFPTYEESRDVYSRLTDFFNAAE